MESTNQKLSAKKGHFAVYLFLVVASEGTLQSPPSQPTAYLHMAKSVSPRARPRGWGWGQILERRPPKELGLFSIPSRQSRLAWPFRSSFGQPCLFLPLV